MLETKRKKLAWITIPAFISTDMFIIPEVAKYYQLDWYLLARKNEKIDFLEQAKQLKQKGIIGFELIYTHYRSSDPRTLNEYRTFLKKIRRLNYDVVYNVMIGIPYYMPLLKQIIGNKKTLIAIHNVHVPKGASLYWPSVLYTKYTIKAFRYFQTFSESQKRELIAVSRNKYCDNVNFVLMDYGVPKCVNEHKEIVFLSFGIIRDYKRIDVIIQAAQLAYKQTNIRFRVIIAGACENWEPYQKMIIYPELFDLRIMRIEDDKVPDLFAETDYFLAPYQDIAQSGSAIIALNYDIPIIASKLEAFQAYIEDRVTGYLIRPANVDDLAGTIIQILNTYPEAHERMKNEIAVTKQKMFSAKAVCRMYRKNIDAVLKGINN